MVKTLAHWFTTKSIALLSARDDASHRLFLYHLITIDPN